MMNRDGTPQAVGRVEFKMPSFAARLGSQRSVTHTSETPLDPLAVQGDVRMFFGGELVFGAENFGCMVF
jgi:hypothetical protein